jgi:hypothetical protein
MKVRRATKAGCCRATRANAWRCSGLASSWARVASRSYRGPDGLRKHGVDVDGVGSCQWELRSDAVVFPPRPTMSRFPEQSSATPCLGACGCLHLLCLLVAPRLFVSLCVSVPPPSCFLCPLATQIKEVLGVRSFGRDCSIRSATTPSNQPSPCRSPPMVEHSLRERFTRLPQLAKRRRSGARTLTLLSFAPTARNTLQISWKSSALATPSVDPAAASWASVESTLVANGEPSATTTRVRICV